MFMQLIDRSPDLKKLRDEGYNILIISNHLVVKDVPYVNSEKRIQYGILVSELTISGDKTSAPKDHTVLFGGENGEKPCDFNGNPLDKIINQSREESISSEFKVYYSFSQKPIDGAPYNDYYKKMTAYINILLSQAGAIDSNVTAKTFPVLIPTNNEYIFEYLDSASSRAGISSVTEKLKLSKIGIVGLGGTGSYILDLITKTPIKEIHIFDSDYFLNHNAFRTPGAASITELNEKPYKVDYLKSIYSKMHKGIFAHNYNIDISNVEELKDMDFVFICIDTDPDNTKKVIVEKLEYFDRQFIDVGLGVELVDDSLNGIVRVVASSKTKRDHLRNRVSLSKTQNENDEYNQNIQIADLNSLNAAIAVIKWKKMCGFYLDNVKEHSITYSINSNVLTSDDETYE